MQLYKYVVVCKWTDPENSRRKVMPFTIMAEDDTTAIYSAEQMLPRSAHNSVDLKSTIKSKK